MTEKIYTCEECEVDFEIVFDGDDEVNYCPFCGEVVDDPEDDEDLEDEDED